MRTVILNNGVEMPVLGIGTSMMEEEDCERMVREALDLGYRFIDTAQAYHNEGAVGRAVRQSDVSRRDVFISTKLSVSNTTYEKAKEGCKRSLDRLGVDYIDLLTLQFPYNDVFGAWRALTELREEGLVGAIGVCNFAADRLADLVIHDRERPPVAQFERHPYRQRPDLMNYLRRPEIKGVARGPFAQNKLGLLTESVLREIAAANGKRVEQVLLRWQIQQDVAVVVNAASPEALEAYLDVFDFTLSDEELAVIAALERDESAVEYETTPAWVEKICRG